MRLDFGGAEVFFHRGHSLNVFLEENDRSSRGEKVGYLVGDVASDKGRHKLRQNLSACWVCDQEDQVFHSPPVRVW